MNPKQQQIIETFGLGQSVVAGAGCGKTTTLVAKCLELLKRNPKARFCAVSFTEKSVRDLREALTKGLAANQRLDASHWVKTIHGLCYTILQEFPVSAGLQGGEKILLEDESARLWERSIQVLWTSTDNPEISSAIERLLQVYNREQLEMLFKKLRSLMSFGVEQKIPPEMADVWLVFQSIYLRYQHAKNRDAGLDFNDLELLALKALQDDSVAQYYQTRFDLVLVDEFQDTNPLQASILERFVKPNYTNLCIVGDPKQSIYRFRDADVSVFQDLAAKLPSKHLLDTNYRSRPGIIDFVNAVCAPTFAASLLAYEALVAGKTEPELKAGEADLSQERVSRLEIENENDLALFLKAEANRGVDLSEYVILARSVRKDKILKFLYAMEAAQVPFLLGSGGRFYSDPRVQELVALLRGWISPKNTLSQAAVLRSPWIGMTDPVLFDWSKRPERSYFEHFFSESAHPLAVALRKLYQGRVHATHFRPGQILEACLSVPSLDEELYLPLVSLWHKAESLSTQGQRFEEIVQYFSNAIEIEKIEKDIPAPAERGMVRVLTIHSAKGLQFPRVILLDLDGDYKSPAALQDLIWDRRRGVHLYRRDDEGKRDKEDPVNVQWSELEKSAQIAESKRVFYVALTRAQEELILVWKKEIKRSKVSELPGYEPFATDNWRAWIEATQIPAAKVFTADPALLIPTELALTQRYQPVMAQDFDARPFRPRHSPSEWLILDQCALRYAWKFSAEAAPDVESASEGLTAELTDAERGSGLHEPDGKLVAPAVNGGVTLNATGNATGNDGASEESVIAALTSLAHTRVPDKNAVAEKGERIHRFLELEDWKGLATEFSPGIVGALIPAVKITLGRDANVKIYRELGFEAPLSRKEALVGMMDRLEINTEARSIRVVDYKFTAKAKSPAELLNTYALQLKLYLWAATKLVDFEPAQMHAELIHFTENALFERIPLEFKTSDLPEIEEIVKTLYKKATLKSMTPTLGDHCRFCEFIARCPAQANT